MARVHRLAQKTPDDAEFMFECPGCGCGHWFKTTGDRPRWTWNGDFERPTIEPSIHVNADLVAPSGRQHRCHSVVTGGRIKFLTDSTHALAGETVELPDMDAE